MASQSPWSSGHGLPDAKGLLVREVREGSPAARAGLAHGDLIVSARAGRYPRSTTWPGALQAAPGDTVELNVVRGTGDRTTHVILGVSGQPRRGSLSSLTPAGTTYLIVCYNYVMQDPADTQPGPDAGVDLSAEAASRFAAAAGLVVDSAGGTRVVGHIDLGPDHHTPWGVVHGGVYTTAVETAASLGASLAVRDRGQFAVGVHNATDFLRPATSGRAEVIAEPLQQGRVQQLWLVTITDERGRALARGQLRLQNVPLPGTGTN